MVFSATVVTCSSGRGMPAPGRTVTTAAARRVADVLLEQTPPQTRIAIQVARIH